MLPLYIDKTNLSSQVIQKGAGKVCKAAYKSLSLRVNRGLIGPVVWLLYEMMKIDETAKKQRKELKKT